MPISETIIVQDGADVAWGLIGERIGFEQCDDPKLFRYDYLVKGFPRLHVPARHPEDSKIPWEDCCAETLHAPWEIGDTLWVRETWAVSSAYDSYKPSVLTPNVGTVQYLAGAGPKTCFDADGGLGRIRPSIFMPRWASRITLKVTDVRVERVQEISRDDIAAEGFPPDTSPPHDGTRLTLHGRRMVFAELWDSINHSRGFGWDANPYVWVVAFKLLELANKDA